MESEQESRQIILKQMEQDYHDKITKLKEEKIKLQRLIVLKDTIKSSAFTIKDGEQGKAYLDYFSYHKVKERIKEKQKIIRAKQQDEGLLFLEKIITELKISIEMNENT